MKTMPMAQRRAFRGILTAVILLAWLFAQAYAQNRGAQHEGIAVHGHWVIDVLNPDGSLASHHEFENALNGGDQALTQLLTGGDAGHWELILMGSGTSPCQGGTGGKFTNACRIIENSVSSPGGTAEFKTLTVTPTAAAGQSTLNTIVLSGTAVAIVTGQVDRVDTSIAVCTGTTAHSACVIAGGPNPFTSATPPAVTVNAGQTIRVTVTISFS